MSTVQSNQIKVWVNAGDKAVTFARVDGTEWARPLFVNVPAGGRETILAALAKGGDGKARRNITWNVPTDAIREHTTKAGDTVDVISLVDIWEKFLSQLEVTNRGQVAPENKAANSAFLASLPAIPDNADDEAF